MFSPSDPLDEDQLRAVTADEPRIAVLAGPGSGKTRTLCQRARFLLQPEAETRALLLTFGNRAASEIKGRTAKPGDVAGNRLFAGTYHAFGATILRSHGHRFGIPADFEIVDRDEALEIAAEVSRTEGVPEHFEPWTQIRSSRGADAAPAAVASFGAAYESRKRELAVVDFSDLIVYTAELFKDEPDLAQAYAQRFPHLLVDEFQDTTELQLGILLAMARHCQTVSIFADDDQAILSFIGARAEYIRRLIEDLDARVFVLNKNYRCRGAIAGHANSLMQADPASSGRAMDAVFPGGSAEVRVYPSQPEEAEELTDDIAARIASGTSPSDIGVLALTRSRLGDLLSELRRRNVPVVDWLGDVHSAAARRLAKLLLSVVLGRLSDRQAGRLCLQLGVPDSGERGCAAFVDALAPSDLKDHLGEMRRIANEGRPASEVVEKAADVAELVATEQEAAIRGIARSLALTEEHDPDRTLDHLLGDLALGGSAATPSETLGVKVATLQGTKGLEWDHVYLVGLEQGTLPFFRATSSDELSEQRRICYVGVTRAAQTLTLSRVTRGPYGHAQLASRFLGEMGL